MSQQQPRVGQSEYRESVPRVRHRSLAARVAARAEQMRLENASTIARKRAAEAAWGRRKALAA